MNPARSAFAVLLAHHTMAGMTGLRLSRRGAAKLRAILGKQTDRAAPHAELECAPQERAS
ncbi:MAG TPA: hypothetical protein VFK82_08460 [Burkholderiaceae bacterium]|nr:hypothetical protein [Burkholderiaceae bacterium]